jgi:hypothetical protein
VLHNLLQPLPLLLVTLSRRALQPQLIASPILSHNVLPHVLVAEKGKGGLNQVLGGLYQERKHASRNVGPPNPGLPQKL